MRLRAEEAVAGLLDWRGAVGPLDRPVHDDEINLEAERNASMASIAAMGLLGVSWCVSLCCRFSHGLVVKQLFVAILGGSTSIFRRLLAAAWARLA